MNQVKLETNLENLRKFLNTNELTINMDKTHLVESGRYDKTEKWRTPGDPPELIVQNNRQQEIVTYSKHLRILGINIQNNMTMTWKTHLETGDKPLLPSLRRNLGALKYLGRQIPPGIKNTPARGLILSILTYLISIWGGATENLIRKAQIIQNAVAR